MSAFRRAEPYTKGNAGDAPRLLAADGMLDEFGEQFGGFTKE